MQDYKEIFDKRGKSYQLAMEKYPDARAEEFQAIAKKLKQVPGSTIIDLPAGGGYLEAYLSNDVNYLAYDFSGEFDDNHLGIQKCKESYIDLSDANVDEAVCLAALHHIVQRTAFYQEIHRILKPGGRVIIADVWSGSKQDPFLNEFIHTWNQMGHEGAFLEAKDLHEIADAGFGVSKTRDAFFWNFASQEEAIDFFRLLFCMDRNPSEQAGIEEMHALGVKNETSYQVRWELEFITCTKS